MPFDCGSASLMTLKFVSAPADSLSPAELNRIVCQAWAHNMRAGLTGEIVLRDGLFHQVIEGSFDAVVPLASRILSDRRHHRITIDHFGSIPERCFETWRTVGFGMVPAAPAGDGAADVIRLHSEGTVPVDRTCPERRRATVLAQPR